MQVEESKTDEILLEASRLYNRGKFKDCLEALEKVSFETFDTREWGCENNKLMCRLKINNDCHVSNTVAVQFQALWEKVRGLPSQEETFPLVTCVGLNYSFCLLSGKMIDSCFQAASILTDNILIASQVFYTGIHSLKSKSPKKEMLFSSSVIQDVLGSIEALLSCPLPSNCFDLIVLNCWVLAVLWMSQHRVEESFKLLTFLNQLDKRKEAIAQPRTIIVDPSISKQLFPVSLLTSTNKHVGYLNLKGSILFLMSLHAKFYQNDDHKALELIESSNDDDCIFYSCFLKGLILYDMSKADVALGCFNRCINIIHVTESNRAAALTMIGCCLNKQDKPYTAIVKFKEALSCDFSHLDALFYVAQQHQKLGSHDVEIQTLQYLCKALKALKDNQTSESRTSYSLLQGPFIPFINTLQGCTITPEYSHYWLGNRCLELQRFLESSDAFFDVISAVTTNTKKMPFSRHAIPSLTQLYRDCAFAMFKSGKSEECVTLCDHAVKGWNYLDSVTEVKNTERKRQRISKDDGDQDTDVLQLLLCKSLALLHLRQPLLSLQSLQRVFDGLGNSLRVGANEDMDSRSCKRRKIDLTASNSIEEALLELNHDVNNDSTCLLRIKSEAHVVRATVLQSMDKEKDAMEELYQSILCYPDNMSAVYQYTNLLFKLGSENAAANNWIKYKELRRDLINRSRTIAERIHMPFLFEVTDKDVQAMDSLSLKYL